MLIALVRAYADLGSLAESQWTADYLAFQARGLLYAQRAVVRDHDVPVKLRGPGVCRGPRRVCPGRRSSDLSQADKTDGGKAAPPWTEALRAFSHSDAAALDEARRGRSRGSIAAYFWFLTRRLSSAIFTLKGSYNMGQGTFADKFCRHEIIAAGRAVLEKVPDCFRVHDGMASVEGVANMHASTSLPLELYPKAVPRRVAAIPGLPGSAARRIGAGAFDEVALRKDLVAAAQDDTSDLTWGVLARQLREIRFLLVCRRLHFLAYSLATDYTDFAKSLCRWWPTTPTRPISSAPPRAIPAPALRDKLRSLDLADFESKANNMVVPLRNRVPDFAVNVEKVAWEHTSLGTLAGQVERHEAR